MAAGTVDRADDPSGEPLADPARRARLQALLLAWYHRTARDLPWRGDADPWAVLVSEAMLQQTQVARVVPIFASFMARWPTAPALAAAPAGEVVAAWQGLGYNRRALRLHRAATVITSEHGGTVPEDLGVLQRLPGVGAYTARAVAAFAHGLAVAPVDTNVARVLARLHGRALSRAAAQERADALVPDRDPGAWGQALMELGARVCTARTPRCDECPVAPMCAWRGQGPDPAASSAHRSRPQARFEGSDRQVRGRLVQALRERPVPGPELSAAAGEPDAERVRRLADALVAEGMAEWDADALRLPR